MLENSIEILAHAIEKHAQSVAELADAIRTAPKAANDTPFVDAVKVPAGAEPPFEPVAPATETPKAPTAEEALKGIPVPPPTAPAPEPVKAEQAPAEPDPAPAYTLENAREFVCRILKWSRTSANADGANPLDKLFADVGAKRVQALTPEQCAKFCASANDFCVANKVA